MPGGALQQPIRALPVLIVAALLTACGDSKERCVEALAALDKDGDLYLPNDVELPNSCEDLGAEKALDEAGLYAGDCDDGDSDRHPNQTEVCGDDIDQDCDGEDAATTTAYADTDIDEYGDPNAPLDVCGDVEGYVADGTDCDDTNPLINPGASELICGDTVDEDCDGVTACPLSGDIDLSGEGWSALGMLVATSPGGGTSLAAGLDVDGDGVSDAAIGGTDAAWILSVGTDRAPVADSLDLGFEEGEEAGNAVALLPDIDGDGLGEIVVGAPLWDDYYADMGRALIRWSASPDEPGVVQGEGKEDYAGAVLAPLAGGLGLGQYTGDSWRVYVLAGDALPGPGASYILDSGSSDTRVTGLAGSGDDLPALDAISKGESSDVVIGQPGYGLGKGLAEIYYGVTPTAGVIDAAGITVETSGAAALGGSVAMADFDADGINDLALGAPSERAIVLFIDIEADTSTSRASYIFSGASGTGSTMAAADDMNGDGAADLLIGAPSSNTVYLVLGGELLPSESSVLDPTATLTGATGSRLGAALASADIDGDGYSDALIGAPGADGVYVLFGGP